MQEVEFLCRETIDFGGSGGARLGRGSKYLTENASFSTRTDQTTEQIDFFCLGFESNRCGVNHDV